MNKNEIIGCLKASETKELFLSADNARKKYCGDDVHIRGIIEFSNFCKRDCIYCGLRKGNSGLFRYRLTKKEIMDAAYSTQKFGYKTIVLQSGEENELPLGELCNIITYIKKELDMAVTVSAGEKSFDEYKRIKDAGADRYLLKFETSDRELFSKLKPDSSYDERMKCIDNLRHLGFQVGSGNMVGLPGQTYEILADDILLLKELDLDMIGIGPFIPNASTPLEKAKTGTVEDTLKVIALARIITKNTHIPATTAIGSIDPAGRQKALSCGANVIMPNVTPQKYRKYYEIYPGKISINDQPGDCCFCIESIVSSLNRKIAKDYGHSFKKR